MAVRHLSAHNRTLPALDWPTDWPESNYVSPSWSAQDEDYRIRMILMSHQCRINFKALDSAEDTNK